MEATHDPGWALQRAQAYLERTPIEHNVILSLLEQRVAVPEPGRYWLVLDGSEVAGFAMRSPMGASVLVSPMPTELIEVLVSAVAAEVEDGIAAPPGCAGEAATAAAFAGRWSELVSGPVATEEGQRLYRLAALRPAPETTGVFRQARAEDHDVLVGFREAFSNETDVLSGDFDAAVKRETSAGRLFVWDDGGSVVSTARATKGVAGVSRIGFVYTPPELRGHGYAAACVSALSARVRDVERLECILYTQLSNPTSNRLYRALGYEAVAERLSYRFDARSRPQQAQGER